MLWIWAGFVAFILLMLALTVTHDRQAIQQMFYRY